MRATDYARPPRRALLGAVALLSMAAVAAGDPGEPAADVSPRREASDALRAKLATPLQLNSAGEAELRKTLAQLARAVDAELFVDRRIDPTTRIRLSVGETSFGQVLDLLAEQAGAEWAAAGDLIYVGPPGTRQGLPVALRDARRRVAKLNGRSRRAWRAKRAIDWERLATPRALVERTVAQAGWRLDDADAVPHDLWPAGATPEMPLGERMTVLLYGFGLDWRPEQRGRTVAIVPR
ncbi:hypothetical protein Mal64_08610 [Pseudobythopirellula maris]|uniref:Secretin/TonB short N-terminal domain-containing protein n=1 Tax=Pseudobythopirellula maris TaxID=2527991 RepID=A0A5C5ZSE9_9BACT|nr:hypothetical protein [Pseudobythopirellula maris]TWT90472.1 hypothetical protein Mal64_08610 [Pseudobythopirellula maris]